MLQCWKIILKEEFVEYCWIWADTSHPKHSKNRSWTCKNQGYAEMIGFCFGLYSVVWYDYTENPALNQSGMTEGIGMYWRLLDFASALPIGLQETPKPSSVVFSGCVFGDQSCGFLGVLSNLEHWDYWWILWSWLLGLQQSRFGCQEFKIHQVSLQKSE